MRMACRILNALVGDYVPIDVGVYPSGAPVDYIAISFDSGLKVWTGIGTAGTEVHSDDHINPGTYYLQATPDGTGGGLWFEPFSAPFLESQGGMVNLVAYNPTLDIVKPGVEPEQLEKSEVVGVNCDDDNGNGGGPTGTATRPTRPT